MRPAHNFLPGEKVSNFKKWAARYFFVRVDDRSFENPRCGRRRVRNNSPGRPPLAHKLAPEFKLVRDTIFAGVDCRWDCITRRRVEEAMGKAKTSFSSFASELGQSSRPLVTISADASGLQSINPNSEHVIDLDSEQVENEFVDIKNFDDSQVDPDPNHGNPSPDDPLQPPQVESVVPEQRAPELSRGARKKKSRRDNKDKGKGKSSDQKQIGNVMQTTPSLKPTIIFE
ncbi:PREDICTED: uncharacterized protein LOC104779623 [Camelina sativa]|uniref:Uncharacterized protein LOC104779623 n=1 Tax=Camelina sativa TaxID=90675 RepID=A0ABM1RLX0_CAMSA|nr:PREDICTED: uncharacterized protein LOC104779623 [Camelina sativa]